MLCSEECRKQRYLLRRGLRLHKSREGREGWEGEASQAYTSTVDQMTRGSPSSPCRRLDSQTRRRGCNGVPSMRRVSDRRRVTLGAPGKILQHDLGVDIIREFSYRH